jgi:hypothetical protein
MLVRARVEIVGLGRRAHTGCHSAKLKNKLIEVNWQKLERNQRRDGEKRARSGLGTHP